MNPRNSVGDTFGSPVAIIVLVAVLIFVAMALTNAPFQDRAERTLDAATGATHYKSAHGVNSAGE